MDTKEKEVRRQLLQEIMDEMNGMMAEKLQKEDQGSDMSKEQPIDVEVGLASDKMASELPKSEPMVAVVEGMPEEESKETPAEEKTEEADPSMQDEDDTEGEINPRFLAKMKAEKEMAKKA